VELVLAWEVELVVESVLVKEEELVLVKEVE
jgi:hypothetical protein